MTDLITPALVRLDADLGAAKHDVIRALAAVAGEGGRAHDVDQLVTDALAREETSPTGLPGGIAIPHCRTAGVSEATLVFARLSPPVDFGSKDGPADLAFLIAAPADGDAAHLKLLTQLARALVRSEFKEGLRSATTAEEVVGIVGGVVTVPAPDAPAPAAPKAAEKPAAPQEEQSKGLFGRLRRR
jgi:PTS system fructose-specific IIC component